MIVLVLAVVLGSVIALGGYQAHGATTGLVQDSISFTQSGNATNTTFTLHSSSGKQVLQALTVAVRDGRGRNLDYQDAFNVSVDQNGYTYKASKSFSSGSYTMFGAYELNGIWKTFPSYTVTTPVAAQLKQSSLTQSQSSSGAEAKLVLSSSSQYCQLAQAVTVAVRDSQSNHLDYPSQTNVLVCPGGYLFDESKSLAAGAYTMFGEYQYNGRWYTFPSQSVTISAAADTTPPSAPQNLTVVQANSSSLSLSWSASADNGVLAGYYVYRGGTQVANVTSGTSFTDTGLVAATAYTYTVKAYDQAGNVSAASNQVTGTTAAAPDTVAPTTPTGLTVGAVTSNSVALSWTASTDDSGVSGYNVYRDAVQVASDVPGVSYTDTGLPPSATHGYAVQAVDQAGNTSALSGSVQATTSVAPNGPQGSWALQFDDEFSGSSVDTAKWSFQSSAESDQSSTPLGTGNLHNQQLEFDQPGNCSVANGALTITGKPDTVTSQSGQHYNWSSCMINTSPSYAVQYGYFEERAQLPSQKGFWSALWTWRAPTATSCSADGETDAFEYYSDNHSNLYLTQHQGSGGSTVYTPSFDPSAAFHTYGVDIEPTGTDYYIDGVNVYHTSATQSCMANIQIDMFVYSQTPPTAGTTEKTIVDYVRSWQH